MFTNSNPLLFFLHAPHTQSRHFMGDASIGKKESGGRVVIALFLTSSRWLVRSNLPGVKYRVVFFFCLLSLVRLLHLS